MSPDPSPRAIPTCRPEPLQRSTYNSLPTQVLLQHRTVILVSLWASAQAPRFTGSISRPSHRLVFLLGNRISKRVHCREGLGLCRPWPRTWILGSGFEHCSPDHKIGLPNTWSSLLGILWRRSPLKWMTQQAHLSATTK